MRGRVRLRVALGTEQALEPFLAQRDESGLDLLARAVEHGRQVAHRDLLLLLVPSDRIGLCRELGLELLVGADQVEPVGVERGRSFAIDRRELVAVAIALDDRELRLRRPQRDLLALEVDARGQDRVLELVVSLGELRRDDPALACLSEPVQPLPFVAACPSLLLPERVELLAAEQIGVPGDDRRLLGRLLLAHPDRASLFGTLVQIPLELVLELGRGADDSRRHSEDSIRRDARRFRPVRRAETAS